MTVQIEFLTEQDEACYKLELFETTEDGGDVYVCTSCGYKRVFYWDATGRDYTIACSTTNHRHCLSVHPSGMDSTVLNVQPMMKSCPIPTQDAPEGWEPRRQKVADGTLDGWMSYTIEAVEQYGESWDGSGGSCGIKWKDPK